MTVYTYTCKVEKDGRDEAMKMFSRKQMGVVYRAMKEGHITIEKSDVSYLYDFADSDFQIFNTSDKELFEKMHYGMKNAVQFIFDGEYESAQVSINNMVMA